MLIHSFYGYIRVTKRAYNGMFFSCLGTRRWLILQPSDRSPDYLSCWKIIKDECVSYRILNLFRSVRSKRKSCVLSNKMNITVLNKAQRRPIDFMPRYKLISAVLHGLLNIAPPGDVIRLHVPHRSGRCPLFI